MIPQAQTILFPKSISQKTTMTCALLLMAMSLAGVAGAATVLTSTTGNVTTESANLAQDDVLAPGDRIELEGNATASLMVDDAAIVRLCHGASLGFLGDPDGSPSAMHLRTGQLKISAGERTADDPLAIHTPTAIATVLGTEAHLAVDLLTGDTVVTSLDRDVRVAGIGDFAHQSVVISTGQKVTIRKGSGPGGVEAADIASASFSSACLDDSRYRVAAVKTARHTYGKSSVQMIAMMDVEETLPIVSAGPPIIPTGTLGPPPIATVNPCLSYQQCVLAAVPPPEFIPGPDPGPAPPPPSPEFSPGPDPGPAPPPPAPAP